MYPTDTPIVVFINPDPFGLSEIRSMLRPHTADLECLYVDEVTRGLGVMTDAKAQILVVNLSMGGAEVAHKARRLDGHGSRRYIIGLAGDNAPMNPDLDEIVRLPARADDLHARIRGGLRVHNLTRDLMKANARLRMDAMTDPVTNLGNRQRAVTFLRAEVARVQRSLDQAGVALFGLDEFKAINDKYGHDVGNMILRDVGEALHLTCRPYDLVARWAGDQFIGVFPGTDQKGALAAVRRHRDALQMLRWNVDGTVIRVTASIGLLHLASGSSADSEDAIRDIENALKSAKYAGSGRIAMAEAAGVAA